MTSLACCPGPRSSNLASDLRFCHYNSTILLELRSDAVVIGVTWADYCACSRCCCYIYPLAFMCSPCFSCLGMEIHAVPVAPARRSDLRTCCARSLLTLFECVGGTMVYKTGPVLGGVVYILIKARV